MLERVGEARLASVSPALQLAVLQEVAAKPGAPRALPFEGRLRHGGRYRKALARQADRIAEELGERHAPPCAAHVLRQAKPPIASGT